MANHEPEQPQITEETVLSVCDDFSPLIVTLTNHWASSGTPSGTVTAVLVPPWQSCPVATVQPFVKDHGGAVATGESPHVHKVDPRIDAGQLSVQWSQNDEHKVLVTNNNAIDTYGMGNETNLYDRARLPGADRRGDLAVAPFATVDVAEPHMHFGVGRPGSPCGQA